MRFKAMVFFGVMGVFLGFCTGSTPADEPVAVTVSIPPQAYFARQIGKDLIRVSVMVPRGASPAAYEPKPTQMAALARSKVYFAIGVPFETAWLDKFARINPDMRMVYTEAGIEKRALTQYPRFGDHGPDVRHPSQSSGPGLDPHIWLSPPLVKQIARHMAAALVQVDPDHQKQYQLNLKEFNMQLERLDRKIREILNVKGADRTEILVFHPSWGYFADHYGLKQVPMEVEGKAPSVKEMLELIQQAKKHHISCIFVQPQFSKRSAKTIAQQIGAKVVTADPLSRDWKTNLIQVARAFAQSLR